MGASGSVMAIVPSPLELHGSGGGDHHASVLPLAYRHLSHFPVLAKVARGPIKPHPNDRITHFLKEHSAVASHIADFLCVKDRLHFLHTHKVGLPPKLLKPLFFGSPSRELDFLYCPAASSPCSTSSSASSPPTGSGCFTNSSGSGCSHLGVKASPTGSPTLGPLSHPSTTSSSSSSHSSSSSNDKGGVPPQVDVMYRGSHLARAVPLRVVASALHRVIRGWLDQKLPRGRDFDAILAMVNKLLTVFRPTEAVWYAIVNEQAEDGSTLLAYAVADARAPLPVIQQLLEIPCLDLGLPDKARRLNPIQLAYQHGRQDVLTYFASLVSLSS